MKNNTKVMSRKTKQILEKIPKTKRTHRKTIVFNDKEMDIVQSFCAKYKIKTQTKFFREAIISTILCKIEEDHPTLF